MNDNTDILILENDGKFKLVKPIQDYIGRLWKFFTSVKLSVILLLTLASGSIIGTVIPQNESPEKYIQAFGEKLYRIFDIFNFFDMYHSWWFQFLILMLSVNIVACSINRLAVTLKIVLTKNPTFNIPRFRKISNKVEFSDNRSLEYLKKIYRPFISKRFGYSRVENTDKGFFIFAEKWRWTRLGVYTVHLSVLLLLLGSLIGSIFGFEGYANIKEGGTINSIKLRSSGKEKALGFNVKCENFSVKFYDSGLPKEYRSNLKIVEAGKTVLQKEIVVNDPLRYKGINFFQSSYGTLAPKIIKLSLISVKTGKTYKKNVTMGQKIELPESMGKFIIKGFRNSAEFRGHNIGEAFLGSLTSENKNPVFMLLPLQYPSFDKMRKGNLMISIAGYEPLYYTGLQVTSDPGVLVVYTGFIMMIIGIFITFFMSHERLCIEVQKSGGKNIILISGTANKNKFSMHNKIKKISEKLSNLKQKGQ